MENRVNTYLITEGVSLETIIFKVFTILIITSVDILT